MSDINQQYTDFDEYIRQGEPSQKEKASLWQTAIGLQAVDGLQTSDYLKATACKHIEGEIDIDEVRELIRSYYQSKAQRVLRHWISALGVISLSIGEFLMVCSSMQGYCVTMTSRNVNGYLMVIP